MPTILSKMQENTCAFYVIHQKVFTVQHYRLFLCFPFLLCVSFESYFYQSRVCLVHAPVILFNACHINCAFQFLNIRCLPYFLLIHINVKSIPAKQTCFFFFYILYQIYFKTVAKIVYVRDFTAVNQSVILCIKLKKLPTCLLHNVKKSLFLRMSQYSLFQ